MGNSAGKDAMGHGTGNCHEVGGDSVTGYLNKSSRIYANRKENHWTKADTFQDSFNSYVTKVTMDINLVGNNNIVFNRSSVGGSISIAGRDINHGQADEMKDGQAEEMKDDSRIRAIELAAVTCDKGHEGAVTKSFTLSLVSFHANSTDLDIAVGDLAVTWGVGDLAVTWGDTETTMELLNAEIVGGAWKLHFQSSVPVTIGKLFGEAMTENKRFPFEGWMKAKDRLSLTGVECDEDRGPGVERIRVAVGEAHGPHRIMFNHSTISQDSWNEGASMSTKGWTHKMDFWAFATEQPETIRIVTGFAYSPHRLMINHDAKSQSEWNNKANSMSLEGFQHYMEFWAYPTEQPGTIRIAVGKAQSPHRAMIFHSSKTQEEWNCGSLMNAEGWTHHMDFWAFPNNNK